MVPGVAGAWTGELDDFDQYLFEPYLGESEPRRKTSNRISRFSLERGNRYLFEVTWTPGSPGTCSLTVEGEPVFNITVEEEPTKRSLEIRSAIPFEVQELLLRGVVPGTEKPGS